jgi:hypothetical protein
MSAFRLPGGGLTKELIVFLVLFCLAVYFIDIVVNIIYYGFLFGFWALVVGSMGRELYFKVTRRKKQ